MFYSRNKNRFWVNLFFNSCMHSYSIMLYAILTYKQWPGVSLISSLVPNTQAVSRDSKTAFLQAFRVAGFLLSLYHSNCKAWHDIGSFGFQHVFKNSVFLFLFILQTMLTYSSKIQCSFGYLVPKEKHFLVKPVRLHLTFTVWLQNNNV